MKHLLCAWTLAVSSSSARPPPPCRGTLFLLHRWEEAGGAVQPPPPQDWETFMSGGHWPGRLASMAEPKLCRCHPTPWLQRAPMGEGGTGRGGGRPWQPPSPHAVPPADAPSTHWPPRTPTRKPNLETKAGRWGQILMAIVGGSGQAARRGPQRGGGGAGNGPGLRVPPLPGRGPSAGED